MFFKLKDTVKIIGILPLNEQLKYNGKIGTIESINWYKTYPFEILIDGELVKCLENQIELVRVWGTR